MEERHQLRLLSEDEREESTVCILIDLGWARVSQDHTAYGTSFKGYITFKPLE
jgi:hypothetical protein